MVYVPRQYTSFQLIAYEVPTLNSVGPGEEYQGELPDAPPAQMSADSRIRLRRLAGLVQAAKQKMPGDSPNTLKIFMAPEFYFRPNAGVHNTYTREESLNLIEQLRTLFQDPAYADWLIVPGSMAWNQPSDGAPGNVIFFNTTFAIKGGPEGPFHYVHKREISGIDGLPWESAAILDSGVRPLLTAWSEQKQNLFRLDQLQLGIEVCLDHLDDDRFRVLKRVRYAWRNRLPFSNSGAVDLHLLTCCGMPVNPNSVAARKGGQILRVDGHPQGSPHSELRRVVSKSGWNKNAQLSGQGADGSDMNQPEWVLDLADAAPGLRLDTVSAEDDASCPQRLVCYPSQPLAGNLE
jgi:hypothetical protein